MTLTSALGATSLPKVTVNDSGALTLPSRTVTLKALALNATATLTIPVTSVTSYGKVSATTASVSGQAVIAPRGTYVPLVGTAFAVITAPTLSGTFPAQGPPGQTYTYDKNTGIITRTS